MTIVDDQLNDSKLNTMFENSRASISEISIPKDSLTIVQDQPTVSNLNPSLLVNAETSRANNRTAVRRRLRNKAPLQPPTL